MLKPNLFLRLHMQKTQKTFRKSVMNLLLKKSVLMNSTAMFCLNTSFPDNFDQHKCKNCFYLWSNLKLKSQWFYLLTVQQNCEHFFEFFNM